MNTDQDSVIQPWHVYVGYLVINIFAFIWNCYAKWLPVIAQISLFTSLISFFVILVAVPASAQTHQDARFVFATFVNGTGWSQNGIGEYKKLFFGSLTGMDYSPLRIPLSCLHSTFVLFNSWFLPAIPKYHLHN